MSLKRFQAAVEASKVVAASLSNNNAPETMTNSEEIVLVTEAADPDVLNDTLPDWKKLKGSEIFDAIIAAIDNKKQSSWVKYIEGQLGHIANQAIDALIADNFINLPKGTKLAKNKVEKNFQRPLFEKLSEDGLDCLRKVLSKKVHLKADSSVYIDDSSGNMKWCPDKVLNVNTGARIMHLVLEAKAQSILEVIFNGGPFDQTLKRAALDDKTTRSNSLWDRLANEFVNNPEWKPVNQYNHYAVKEIDPSQPPVRPLKGEEVRTVFNQSF